MNGGGMMIGLALLMLLGGWIALALAMPRHARQMLGRDTAKGSWVRFLGWVCLGLSYLFCGLAWGWRIGSAAWFCVATATGLALIFLLPYWAAYKSKRPGVSSGPR